MPGRKKDPAREPREPLRRERVLHAAIEIADQRGVGAVTMRAVAAALGVEAMSLYNHVRNKDEILDGMVDLVVEEIHLPADTSNWREAMRLRAVSARAAFLRHPWASALVDSRESSGPTRLRYFDLVLGVLVRAGFSLEAAVRGFSVLDSYIYGFGRQQLNMSASGAPAEEAAAAILSVVPAERYPYLNRVATQAMTTGYDAESDFEFGLGIILDGLEKVLAEGTRA
jgi:AcrR family transcriptional regulator